MRRPSFFHLTYALLAAGGAGAVQSQTGQSGGAVLAKYQQECSACHIAYPAGMLPATSWVRVMGSLGKHFGTDASLDAASVAEISGWLKPRAGTLRRVSENPPQDRITLSPWFVREHDEVASPVWKRASVGSAANCAACHVGAAKGNFNERDVQVPK